MFVQNLQIDYDRQTEQLDKEREKVESAERQIAELTKRLSSAVTQVPEIRAPLAHHHQLLSPRSKSEHHHSVQLHKSHDCFIHNSLHP